MALPVLYGPVASAGIQEQNQTGVEKLALATALHRCPAAEPGQNRGEFPAAAALTAWWSISIWGWG